MFSTIKKLYKFYGKLLILMFIIPFLIYDKLQQLLSVYFPIIFVILLVLATYKYKNQDTTKIPTITEQLKNTNQYKLTERLIQTINKSYK